MSCAALESIFLPSKGKKSISISGISVFISPIEVTSSLKQDEKDLNQQLIMMLFILAIRDFFRPENASDASSHNADHFCLDSITNREVSEFWRDYIGSKV